jgi:hypothetical protein
MGFEKDVNVAAKYFKGKVSVGEIIPISDK